MKKMAHDIPKVYDNSLEQSTKEGGIPHSPTIDSAQWYLWLEDQHTFRFEASCGAFTTRKEQQQGSWYWYAYRRGQKKLHTTHLGKSEDLTLEHLNEIARAFASPTTSAQGITVQTLREEGPSDASMNDSLLSTKLYIPPASANIVARPRLTERLDQGMSHKLTLVSAPAGFGKTTLLSEWVQQSKYPLAWVSLDERDNDPVSFWSYVIMALKTLHTDVGETAFALLRSLKRQPPESVLTALINTLMVIPSHFALVLDDYHVLQTPSIHETVLFLLDHLPPHMHLVIASRSDPPISLARLRGQGELTELRTADLQFLCDEVKTFLVQRMRLELSEEMLTVLKTRTEGWVTGLQLAALSLQQQEDREHFLATFAGSHRYILDYLVEEVFARQSQSMQDFLLSTSILDRLSASLGEAVSGQQDGQALLEQLERSNLFLFPLDDQRCWYRYHPLFREALRTRLQRMQPEQVDELYRRATCWCKQNDLASEAVDYALAGRAFEEAAALIALIGETMIKRCEVMTLLLWLEQLPDDLVRSCPQLCFLRAWTLIILGRFQAAEPWLQEAESRLREVARISEYVAEATYSSKGEMNITLENMLGKVAALHAHAAAFWGDISSTTTLAQQALDHLSPDDLYLRALSAMNLGIAYWLQGDVSAASQVLAEASSLGRETENRYVALIATSALALVQMVQGQRRLAVKTGQQALQLAAAGKSGFPPAAPYAYVVMGQLLYEWNELDAAEHYLRQGIAVSEQWHNEHMFVYGSTELAQVKLAQGAREEVGEMLRRTEQYMEEHQPHSWIVTITAAQQAKLALMQGHVEEAERRLQQVKEGYMSVFKQILHARIHLAQGQPGRALTIVEQQLLFARSTGQMGLVVELCILQALIYQQRQDTIRALGALRQALSLAEPEGYIRMFVDEGEPMVMLLVQALADQQRRDENSSSHVSPQYIGKLLVVLGKPVASAAPVAEESTSPANLPLPAEALSEREWEIVHLIVKGMSNREIAQQLIVAETTVKWHLRNIFSKLHVRNRSQIVALVAKERV